MTALSLKHKYVSTKAQGGDPSIASKNEWNDDHNLWWGVRAVTITSDSLVDADKGSIITYTNASAIAATIAQAGASGSFALGWFAWLRCLPTSTGSVTLTPATSTINGLSTLVLAPGQDAMIFSDGANYIALQGGVVNKLNVSGIATIGGVVSITDSTAASSTTTGALQVTGGLGLGGKLWAGDTIVGYGGQNSFGAAFSGRAAQKAFEWGHPNTSGYGCTIGHLNNGSAFVAMHAQLGTNINTYKTTGLLPSIIQTDLAGGFVFGNVGSASADNQSLTALATLVNGGVLTLPASTASTSTTTGVLVVTGGVGIGGDTTVGGNIFAGPGTGSYGIRVNGGNSGTDNGGFIGVKNNGTAIIFIGNKSAIIGGTYDATPFIYSTAAIHVNSSAPLVIDATTASTSSTTGALVVAGGVGIAGTVSIGAGGALRVYSTALVRFDTALYLGDGTADPSPAGKLNIGWTPVNSYGISFRGDSDTYNGFPVLFLNNSNTTAGAISQTSTTVAYSTSSDMRLKTDPQMFDGAAIIDALKPYDFQWISTGERAHGVYAQEAEEIFPEAVTYMKMEDHYSVDYSKFVPVILRALQQAQTRITALEVK